MLIIMNASLREAIGQTGALVIRAVRRREALLQPFKFLLKGFHRCVTGTLDLVCSAFEACMAQDVITFHLYFKSFGKAILDH